MSSSSADSSVNNGTEHENEDLAISFETQQTNLLRQLVDLTEQQRLSAVGTSSQHTGSSQGEYGTTPPLGNESALQSLLVSLLSKSSNNLSGKSISITEGDEQDVQDAMSGLTESPDDLQQRLYRGDDSGVKKSPHVVSSISDWLKSDIFPYVKFWSDSEKKFDYPDFASTKKEVKDEQARMICEGLLRFINAPNAAITLEHKVRFWITYRTVVKKELVKYRCNASQQIKDLYVKAIRKYNNSTQEQRTKENLLDPDPLLQLVETKDLEKWRDSENFDAFEVFVRYIIPPVVRKMLFRVRRTRMLVSQFVTIPDEAFAILILENNADKWKIFVEDERGLQSMYGKTMKPKFCSGSSKDSYMGNWSQEGIERFNILCDLVAEKRKQDHIDDDERKIKDRLDRDFGKKSGYYRRDLPDDIPDTTTKRVKMAYNGLTKYSKIASV